MEEQNSATVDFLNLFSGNDLLQSTDLTNNRETDVPLFVNFLINNAVQSEINSEEHINTTETFENNINKNEEKINYEFDINPLYSTLSDRLKSFKHWPKYYHIKPKVLSSAGFFYFGVGDYVKCVCCDLVLHDWKPDDDPIIEHVNKSDSHNMHCEFVKLFLEYSKDDYVLSESDSEKKKKKKYHKK